MDETRLVLCAPGFPPDARPAPGDLSQYAPQGNGVAVHELPRMPWGGAAPTTSPGYALHPHVWEPMLGAPISEPGGGVVYFDHSVRRDRFEALLQFLEVRTESVAFLAYLARAADIGRERFVSQLRLVSHFAVSDLYRSRTELAPQTMTMGEALWAFMESMRGPDIPRLNGTLGGDGDWASERMGFGFLVENSYFGVYRIWSRPWLITK